MSVFIASINGTLVECGSALALAYLYDVRIDDKGVVTVGDKTHSMSYKMDEWSEHEALFDFCRWHLPKLFKIYKGERL